MADSFWNRCRQWLCCEILRCLLPGRKAMTNLDSLRKQRHHRANKGPYSQSYGFSSSHVWMWELDHKEGWVPKNWYFRTVVLEKALESPLDSKAIELVSPKGNQPWIFIGRTSWSWSSNTLTTWCKELTHWKHSDAGKDWGQEKRATGWDGWMASLTQWMWVWANSGR